jgi:metal-responsive CopG/Arc/MetJ family transcriptional regulator
VKTTITLPNALFRRAERAALKMGISRSRLVAAAITEFLETMSTEKTTKRLNRVYSQEPSKLDPVLESVQTRSVAREKW